MSYKEIQTFLLDIGQEEYTIPILNGIKWNLKMNPTTLAILRAHKHQVAARRAVTRTKQQTHTEEEIEIDINQMTTAEREIHELKQLMGESETLQEEAPATGREKFRKYEYTNN